MPSLLKQLTGLFTGNNPKPARSFKAYNERQLIEMEAVQGQDIFGQPDKGCQREFFCLDRHTWIWYEEWLDEKNEKHSRTTRYEIHDNGIMKVQDGAQYQFLDEQELRNFAMAVRIYYERVMKNVFKRDPVTGASLSQA